MSSVMALYGVHSVLEVGNKKSEVAQIDVVRKRHKIFNLFVHVSSLGRCLGSQTTSCFQLLGVK